MEENTSGRDNRLPVDIEGGLTLDDLIGQVQAARGKPMEIHELPALANESGALCGLWLDTETRDIVLHAPSDSALHRQQFVLHELAHMILQHDRNDQVFSTGSLLPTIEGARVVKALARNSLNNPYELDAEALADELAAAIRRSGEPRFFQVFG
ncbi:ImmA/IrrE family metallo-endopeptidase [Microbacterium hominis]|uniref:Uncharacterized protein n=1 Tax=Microbacterium hominis TaxID=162426 RepID=A0A2K9DQH3_9MICO|nr:ImmA/IrrE family metallo-endopeptidase [Microbacterium hominis]AUG29476.1 hypothetical protein CXR34_08370 [Microbacterium hominis]